MKQANYAELSRELDGIIEQLQAAEVDIDEAVKLYERGTTLVKELEKYLKTAENKITKLQLKQ